MEVVYLLLQPYKIVNGKSKPQVTTTPKGAPYFFRQETEIAKIDSKNLNIDGTKIKVNIQVLDDLVWVAECRYKLSENNLIQNKLKEKFITNDFYEEYFILLLQDLHKNPSIWVKNKAHKLAKLLRATDKPLNEVELKKTFETRVSYSERDLTIVDWEGAIIIAEEGDFQADIDLLKVGNYQILRYRMIDRDLENKLQKLQELVAKEKRSFFPRQDNSIYKLVNQRLELLLSFEKVSQSLLSIGDWYSAKLYRAIVNEFYLDEWKEIVANKLDSLDSIYDVVTENLTFSWDRLWDVIQIIGWLLLLVGYFVIFFLERR
jgi:hypothetical protein